MPQLGQCHWTRFCSKFIRHCTYFVSLKVCAMVCDHEASDFVPYSTRIRNFFDRWPGCKVGLAYRDRFVPVYFLSGQEPIPSSLAGTSGEAGWLLGWWENLWSSYSTSHLSIEIHAGYQAARDECWNEGHLLTLTKKLVPKLLALDLLVRPPLAGAWTCWTGTCWKASRSSKVFETEGQTGPTDCLMFQRSFQRWSMDACIVLCY